jgi:hypothetical protein
MYVLSCVKVLLPAKHPQSVFAVNNGLSPIGASLTCISPLTVTVHSYNCTDLNFAVGVSIMQIGIAFMAQTDALVGSA